MGNIFVISDTHFFHKNILNFKDEDGKPIRPGFSSVEEMNELIIDNWNKEIKDDDTVYHLGDFTFGNVRNIALIAPRLKGHKRLILGNHDYEAKDYYPHFKKVMSWRQFGTNMYKIPLYLCHYPLDESAFNYRHRDKGLNVFGHLHEKDPKHGTIDTHVCVCVERTNYKPINLEDIADGKFRNTRRI